MFGDILQGLLCSPKHTAADGIVNVLRQIDARELHLKPITFFQLSTEAIDRQIKPADRESRRMQLLRERTNIRGKVRGVFHEGVDFRACGSGQVSGPAKLIEIDLQERKPLNDVVVQFASDASPFGFLLLEQPAAKMVNPLVARTQLRLI